MAQAALSVTKGGLRTDTNTAGPRLKYLVNIHAYVALIDLGFSARMRFGEMQYFVK